MQDRALFARREQGGLGMRKPVIVTFLQVQQIGDRNRTG
jgi:hypothetical protein